MAVQAKLVPAYNALLTKPTFTPSWKEGPVVVELSGITLISIGTTFGTPRVTITFS